MQTAISLDAHAHIDPWCTTAELSEAGAALAMTLWLDEAEKELLRQEQRIAWVVGCHPRKLAAQNAFDPERFADLALKSPVIGKISLDVAYRIPCTRIASLG